MASLFLAVVLLGCAHLDRDNWQKPAEVIERLAIEPGARIADLGSGDGYFTFRLAEATGSTGIVYAVDIDEEELAEVEVAAAKRGIANVKTRLATFDDSKLDAASVDLVFLCNTFHHIEGRVAYFERLRSVIAPGGRLAVIELDDLPWFVPLWGHETEASVIEEELAGAGYQPVDAWDGLPHQSYRVFTVASDPAAAESAGAADRPAETAASEPD